MTKKSAQKFIARNRAPRVQIEYDVEFYGASRKIQLPFVMGVMADLAGKPKDGLPSLEKRQMFEIDVDNFDDRMRAMQPRVAFNVPNTLTGKGNLSVDIAFDRMGDFSPAAVARKVEPLRKLLEARTELTTLLAYMDGKARAEDLIAKVIQDPAMLRSLAAMPRADEAPPMESPAEPAADAAPGSAASATAPGIDEAPAEATNDAPEPEAEAEPTSADEDLDALLAAVDDAPEPEAEAEPTSEGAHDDLDALLAGADDAPEPEVEAEPTSADADDGLDALLAGADDEPEPEAEAEPMSEGADEDLDALLAAVDDAPEPDADGSSDDDLDALLAAVDDAPEAEAEAKEAASGGGEGGAYRVNFGALSGPRPNLNRGNASPFRIAVLGDFSARASAGKLETGEALAARKPIKVDIDNLDDVIARMGIEMHLPIGADGGAVAVPIRSMDDFHPDELYDNLAIFEELSGLRLRLTNSSTFESAAREVLSWGVEAEGKGKRPKPKARGAVVPVGGKLSDFARLVGRPTAEAAPNTSIDALLKQVVGPHIVPDRDPRQDELLAAVDEALSDAMRSVLHHPDFQYLESIWRSIDMLVRRLETSSRLQIVLYDVSAEEIAADLSARDEIENTGLYKLLVEQPALDDHQGALSAIVGNYTFEMTPPHAELLGRLAKIASHGQAPFVASLGADCLGLDYDDPHPLIKNTWGALRALPEAAYLGLALPRFMLRMPYGKKTDPIDPFEFEEFTPKTGLKSMLWGDPAIIVGLLLGEGYSREGLKMQLGSVMTVGDMPFHFYTDADGDQTALPCTERLIPVRLAERMSAQRFMPLVSIRGRPEIRLGSFQSLGGGPLAGAWTGPAEAAAAAKKAKAEAAAVADDGAVGAEGAAPRGDDDPDRLLGGDYGGSGDFDLDSLDLGSEDGAGVDADLDALLSALDSDDADAGDDDSEMDPELAALLADL